MAYSHFKVYIRLLHYQGDSYLGTCFYCKGEMSADDTKLVVSSSHQIDLPTHTFQYHHMRVGYSLFTSYK